MTVWNFRNTCADACVMDYWFVIRFGWSKDERSWSEDKRFLLYVFYFLKSMRERTHAWKSFISRNLFTNVHHSIQFHFVSSWFFAYDVSYTRVVLLCVMQRWAVYLFTFDSLIISIPKFSLLNCCNIRYSVLIDIRVIISSYDPWLFIPINGLQLIKNTVFWLV